MGNNCLVRAMASMGGGIAFSGGPCGALTGAVVFIGSLFGKDEPGEKDSPLMHKACDLFYRRFENEVAKGFDSINCRDMTGVDWKDPVQVNAFRKGNGRIMCASYTGKAARILGEVLEETALKAM
jgi:C_GCAxxG_C_C family probable redox protein